MVQYRFKIREGSPGVKWQVTLCDPIWQVTPRSSVMGFPIKNLARILRDATEFTDIKI